MNADILWPIAGFISSLIMLFIYWHTKEGGINIHGILITALVGTMFGFVTTFFAGLMAIVQYGETIIIKKRE